MRIILPLCISLTIIGIGHAQAQVPVGDALDDYARLMQLTGAVPSTSVTVRPSLMVDSIVSLLRGRSNPWAGAISARQRLNPATPLGMELTLAPLSIDVFWNSERPWGTNDGAVWQGRGHTVAIGGGVALGRGRWSAAIRPQLIRTANAAFALSPLAGNSGLSPFSYPSGIGQTIDMPQRFGADPFTTFDLGQSYVRGEFGPVAVGLSNENMWWGPGRRNAISMTNNAPGFGHVFLGTARPANVGIGRVSARWVWGRLRESRYFDADAANDSRFMTGIVASFSPDGVPGLELGATRSFMVAWREHGPNLSEVMSVFVPLEKKSFTSAENPSGNDAADQVASIFFRWVLLASGFEFYGEWGKGDHSWDLRDLFVEPEHASGWILGFQKAFASEERIWRFASELTVLGAARTSTLRAPPSAFYVHHIIRQGYTQRGQVMGAGIGPGSSQVYVGLDRFARWGKLGVALQRTALDNNRFYAEPRSYDTHEVEPALLLDALLHRGPFDVGASAAFGRLLNQHYVARNDHLNVNLGVSLRYHFPSR